MAAIQASSGSGAHVIAGLGEKRTESIKYYVLHVSLLSNVQTEFGIIRILLEY
jgi:hypothetical protein